jgi:2-keto-4-pentenoate hydratase/2-oxohepta-3-ene-1,7-dioic acid hydratase in catechol pathway
MAVNIVRFEHGARIRWGIVRAGRIRPITGDFASTGEFIARNLLDSLLAADSAQLGVDTVRILSPVTVNQQFICQGANYRQHMLESGLDPDAQTFNMIFTKASSCICAADADIVKPSHVQLLDYEIELGLVLRSRIDRPLRITDSELSQYVAGLVIVNDVSARDIQIPQMQFYKRKSYRSFGPVGPYLCLLQPPDYARIRQLELTLTVNGQQRQHDTTANRVWGPSETLTELSATLDLAAGDLLATGTPAGCALSVPRPVTQRLAALLPERKKWESFFKIQARRPQYLKVGDIAESRICGADGSIDLGRQRNRVVEGP